MDYKFSTLTAEEKQYALGNWEKQWASFLDYIIQSEDTK
jgi:hypothetical protein